MIESLTLPPLYLYVARLIRMFPFTHHIVSYISSWPGECKRRYPDPFLLKIANETLADEMGHDKLILKDLQDLNIPIEIALKEFRSRSVEYRISVFTQSVAMDPLHLLAWLFYAEKLAIVHVTKEVLEGYQEMLGPFHAAVRFWKVHSAVGPEVQHVAKRQQWIRNLPFYHRQIVERELEKVTLLFSNQQFDLDFEKFEHFMNHHAPHLYEIAYRDAIDAMDRFHFEMGILR